MGGHLLVLFPNFEASSDPYLLFVVDQTTSGDASLALQFSTVIFSESDPKKSINQIYSAIQE